MVLGSNASFLCLIPKKNLYALDFTSIPNKLMMSFTRKWLVSQKQNSMVEVWIYYVHVHNAPVEKVERIILILSFNRLVEVIYIKTFSLYIDQVGISYINTS